MARELYYRGDLYPDTEEELFEQIDQWKQCVEEGALDFNPSIAVLPHAPYEIAGVTSFVTLSQVDFTSFKRVVLIGPSNQFVFEGVSILAEEEYESLQGSPMAIDVEYTFDLKKGCELSTVSGAHRALSTEIVTPVLKTFTDLPLVELIFGVKADEELKKVIEKLLEDPGNFIIVSANLSKAHHPRDAHSIDRHVINGIMSLSEDEVKRGESKAMSALCSLLGSLKQGEYSSEVLDYRTSADVGGETYTSVEGYVGALLGPLL